MPALAPVPPRVFKRMLELAGYDVVKENKHTWVLVCNAHPAVVPKLGELIALDAMESVLNAAQINNAKFFELLATARNDLGITEGGKVKA